MKKATQVLAVLLVMALTVNGVLFAQGDKDDAAASDQQRETSDKEVAKVGIVLSMAGRGDKSFNDTCIKGLENAVTDFGITYKDIQPRDMANIATSLEFLAKEGYNPVFAIGFDQAQAVEEIAALYPDTNFAIVDFAYAEPPMNVQSLVFRENEGSFLAGAFAALMTKTGTIGFVGGMDMSLMHRFEGGFVTGAEYINPDVDVLVSYAGTDLSAFNNPDKGKEITYDFVLKGADIVYHASGPTGQGVFEAAEAKGIYAIGVDANQNWIKPGVILASMLKRMDVAVYDVVKESINGSFKGGQVKVFDVANQGIGLTDLSELTSEELTLSEDAQKVIQRMKDNIPQNVKDEIKALEAKIISGDIVVEDWMISGKPE